MAKSLTAASSEALMEECKTQHEDAADYIAGTVAYTCTVVVTCTAWYGMVPVHFRTRTDV